jgi:ABC-2 type transport system permease protein
MSASSAGYLALARRSVLRSLRQPAAWFPSLLFPIVLLAVSTAGLRTAVDLHAFPGGSYLAFALAGVYVQAAMVAGINSGADIAVDIQSGFLNRLALTPIRRIPLLLASTTGALTVSVTGAVLYTLLGLVLGVHFAAGIGGMALALALAVAMSLAFSGLGAVLALKTGSSEAVLGFFPVTFVLLTFSSFFLPRALMENAWFRTVAGWNPATYMIEAVRSLLITGWDGRALLLGVGICAAIVLVCFRVATGLLRARLAVR